MESTSEARERDPFAAATGGDEGQGLHGKGVTALVIGLLFPGGGHLIAGRWRRGLLLMAVIVATFVLGVALSGRVYVVSNSILPLFYVFGDAGLGAIYGLCLLANIGLAVHAEQPTFEYGSNLILVAGLLNYLVALDAYDIAAGRKS